jgi:hypothetical protein
MRRRVAILLVSAALLSPCPLAASDRKALVVGNSRYREAPLVNPERDARAMADVLSSQGFDVELLLDAGSVELRGALDRFASGLSRGDTALLYYAGHGVQIQGHNYLLPVDSAAQSEDAVARDSPALEAVLDRLNRSPAARSIVVMDACRDNPFASRARSLSRGLSVVKTPSNTLVAYATGPGQVAADGTGENGLFTTALLKYLRTRGLEINSLLTQVRRDVAEASGQRQVPFVSSSLAEAFWFNPDREQALSVQSGPAAVEYATVRIEGAPAGTLAYVDGLLRGQDLASLSLSPGTYRLELGAPGYERWRNEIELAAGARVTVTPDLRPDPNRLLAERAFAAVAAAEDRSRLLKEKANNVTTGSMLLGVGVGWLATGVWLYPFEGILHMGRFADSVSPWLFAGGGISFVAGAVIDLLAFLTPVPASATASPR